MFERLFEGVDLGPVTLKNRLELLPHNTLYDLEGLRSYLSRRAQGGVGLVEVSMATAIRDIGEFPDGPVGAWPYKGYDVRVVPAYSALSSELHKYGAKVFMELSAAGGNRSAARGVSRIPGGAKRVTPREYDEKGIAHLVEDHAAAAKLLQKGGFDGVDLHATHGMLLEEFYSRATNRRNDAYGGSLENRVRVIREILRRSREETKGELALGMRIDASDMLPGGNGLEEEVLVGVALKDELDFLNVDLGFEHQFMHLAIAPMYQEPGYQLEFTAAFKRALPDLPVGAAGRIVDPVMAEAILEKGTADVVGMTRALIADPDLPNKAKAGDLEDIRPCLGDNQRCIGNMMRNLPMRCTVNPAVGIEGQLGDVLVPRAETVKRVVVIGGGVAGMEAARVASLRGHSVVLYERDGALGGQLSLATMLPGREDLLAIVPWYRSQLRKAGVRLELRREVSVAEDAESLLREEAPDAVVLATGSSPIRDGVQAFNYAPIPGHEFCVTLDDVLKGAPVKPRVLIVDDSGFVEGLALSELLSRRGSEVELVTRDPAPGMDLQWSMQLPYLYERAMRQKVVFTANTHVRRVEKDSVLLYNVYTGEESRRKGERTVVLNTGRVPRDELYALFDGKVKELITVGDCNLARREIGESIAEAFQTLRKL